MCNWVTQVHLIGGKETQAMVSLHLHDSFSLMGTVVGVIFAPIIILGSLFLIVRAVLGF